MSPASALLFDLGNTRIKAALGVGDRLQGQAAFAFADADCWERVGDWLDAHAGRAAAARLACVTRPARRTRLRGLLRQRGLAVHEAGPPASDDLLQLAYPKPERMGVDRWLALRALRRRLDGGFVLACCGSALTVDTVSASGRHLGGVIAPAPERALEALRRRARHLPEPDGPVTPFAIDTGSALRSGALLAAQGLIEHVLHAAETELGAPLRLVLAGGGAAALLPGLQARASLREHAVLEGLADWAAGQLLPGPA
ncbi:type III pantothenate kinase [Pseudomarimonas salicorniae]|uniref:Type III pantothenate kinase n=1 Tax=Pseudomarimonas salicorniae TaxID=2933270 RepID=A0ABT0GCS3_9GAMM|nr:type III pantothenate kinase [Lysobacter sp. CAU 1642]MCK7592228.1 type III pantothenate kinase [Lysobacter sp. CAU 1642]